MPRSLSEESKYQIDPKRITRDGTDIKVIGEWRGSNGKLAPRNIEVDIAQLDKGSLRKFLTSRGPELPIDVIFKMLGHPLDETED